MHRRSQKILQEILQKITLRYDDLHTACYIFNSDDAQPVVKDLSVGFDSGHNLVVLLEHTDYANHCCDCADYAIVTRDEASELARRLSIAMVDIPDHLSRLVTDYHNIVNPTPDEVADSFRAITDHLLAHGLHPRFHHIP